MKQVDNGSKPKGVKITEECWINKAEWDFHKAWRHKAETIMHVFKMNQPGEVQKAKFNKEYNEAYPENAKILNK